MAKGKKEFRLGRAFFDANCVMHERGAVLSFEEGAQPSSALEMGSEEEIALAKKLGLGGAKPSDTEVAEAELKAKDPGKAPGTEEK